MDKLSHLIEYELNQQHWKPFCIGKNGVNISHLMFVDDLLLFGEITEKQWLCITQTLQIFCCMLGQEVSIEKSNIIFSNNVSRRVRPNLVHLSRYHKIISLGKYLGVPLKGESLRNQDFGYVLDQISKKLSS